MSALIAPDLLKHLNTNVRVSVASCICEILRITAPTPPYNDEQMREVFQLIVATFGTLSPGNSCYFKSLSILENVAKTRLCLEMLDLECDALVIEMFQHFLIVAKFHCPDATFVHMEAILTMVLEESDGILKELLCLLLDSVRNEDMHVESLFWQLGKKVITNCADKLKPYLMEEVKSLGFVLVLDDYAPIIASICEEIVGVAKQQASSALHEYEVDTSKLVGTSSDMAILVALDTVIEVASPPKATPIVNSITSQTLCSK